MVPSMDPDVYVISWALNMESLVPKLRDYSPTARQTSQRGAILYRAHKCDNEDP